MFYVNKFFSCADFKKSEQGNIIIILALLLTILIGLGGGVVDVSTSYLARTRLQSAVDNASSQIGVLVKSKLNTTSNISVNQAVAEAKNAVIEQLSESIKRISGTEAGSVHYTLDVQIINQNVNRVVTVNATANAVMHNSFLGVFGKKSTALAVNATATTNLPTFINVSFLVDISQSMGIGGNATSIKTMLNDTNVRCMFACHDSTNTYEDQHKFWGVNGKQWNNTWLYLKCSLPNVSTRLDDATLAINASLDTLSKNQYNKYAATILTFGSLQVPSVWSLDKAGNIAELAGQVPASETCPKSNTAISYLNYNNQLSATTQINRYLDVSKFQGSDHFNIPLASLKKIVNLINIENKLYNANDVSGTDSDDVIYTLAKTFERLNIRNNSTNDGSNSSLPKQIVILITDGAQNWTGFIQNSALHGGVFDNGLVDVPIDTRSCDLMKQFATLAIIYVPPIDVTNETIFQNIITSPPYSVLSAFPAQPYTQFGAYEYDVISQQAAPSTSLSTLSKTDFPYSFVNVSYRSYIDHYGVPQSTSIRFTNTTNYPNSSEKLTLHGKPISFVKYLYTPNQITPPLTASTTAPSQLNANGYNSLVMKHDRSGNPEYDYIISPPPFEANMQKCATSSDYFFKVDTTNTSNSSTSVDAIAQALNKILATVDQRVVLSR
jgi:Flp pilus assembly protein TadG